MKIGILGIQGRMGQMIAQAIDSGAHKASIGAEMGRDGNKEAAFAACDVMIDFTTPEAAVAHAKIAAQMGKPLVTGTTGLSVEQQVALGKSARTAPILHAANMSLGVNLLLSLVERAAEKLGAEFDIEIFEAHHRNKIDAPSGTALALGTAAAKGRGVALDDVQAIDRQGKRKPGDIGFSVFRGGDVVGEHTVTFAGAGERIELAHKATDRMIFAHGAVKAALWLKDKPPGLYSMRDVLGL